MGEEERLDGMGTTVLARTGTKTQRRLKQTTLTEKAPEVKCPCGKIFKNLRGLRVH